MLKNKELIGFLKTRIIRVGFKDRLKIIYRPLICPFSQLLSLFNTKDSVLDIGCGSGQFALLLANYIKPKKIKGIEINQKLIENASKLLESYSKEMQIEFSVYNGFELPEDMKSYNKIILIDVLHHIPINHQNLFLKQIYNKMELESILIIKDIEASSPLVVTNKLHDLIFSGEVSKEISNIKLNRWLLEIGFKVENVLHKTMFLYPHYIVIAKKT